MPDPFPVSSSIDTFMRSTTLSIAKSAIGLGNVDNTSDMAKPVSTAQLSAFVAKQNLPTYVRTTLTTGANTITSPGSASTNGDLRIYMLKQPLSGAAGTITFNPIFVFPDGFIPNVSTTNSKTDLMEVTFDSVVSKWVVTKFIGGYSL